MQKIIIENLHMYINEVIFLLIFMFIHTIVTLHSHNRNNVPADVMYQYDVMWAQEF